MPGQLHCLNHSEGIPRSNCDRILDSTRDDGIFGSSSDWILCTARDGISYGSESLAPPEMKFPSTPATDSPAQLTTESPTSLAMIRPQLPFPPRNSYEDISIRLDINQSFRDRCTKSKRCHHHPAHFNGKKIHVTRKTRQSRSVANENEFPHKPDNSQILFSTSG